MYYLREHMHGAGDDQVSGSAAQSQRQLRGARQSMQLARLHEREREEPAGASCLMPLPTAVADLQGPANHLAVAGLQGLAKHLAVAGLLSLANHLAVAGQAMPSARGAVLAAAEAVLDLLHVAGVGLLGVGEAVAVGEEPEHARRKGTIALHGSNRQAGSRLRRLHQGTRATKSLHGGNDLHHDLQVSSNMISPCAFFICRKGLPPDL